MQSKVVNTKLGDIEYCSVGKGIPVVFIHGGHSNCFESLCYKGFDDKKFQLITPSRPGYGKTPLNHNKTPKQSADIIIELIEHLKLNHVIIYAISAGGLTGIEIAANYPNKVSKLILASAVSKKWLNPDDVIYRIAKRMFNPKMEKITWGMVKFFSKIFPKMIAKSFHPEFSGKPLKKFVKPDINELLAAMKHYSSKAGFINDIDQDIREITLSKIKCPTLIIHSKNDNSVSFSHAEYAAKNIEGSKLIELNNDWGHLFWIGKDSKDSINKTIEFVLD